jgi:2-dehydro-3-deoxyphosphogalactonate aldolase
MLIQPEANPPLIAILRGLTPPHCLSVTEILLQTGYRMIEVPLTSPEALASIRLMAKHFKGQALFGAGTVTQAAQLWSVPGCATATEAFRALAAGADMLKLFPANNIPPATVKALCTVLPKDSRILAVGGIDEHNMAAYLQAGCCGFGLGSNLFQPSFSLSELQQRAELLMEQYIALVATR